MQIPDSFFPLHVRTKKHIQPDGEFFCTFLLTGIDSFHLASQAIWNIPLNAIGVSRNSNSWVKWTSFLEGMNEHFQNSGEKQPQGVKMKQALKHSCSEVGMVLRSSRPWYYTDAGFISCLSAKWERGKCPLHTHYRILPEGLPPPLYFNFLPKSLGKDVRECGSVCAATYISFQLIQCLAGIWSDLTRNQQPEISCKTESHRLIEQIFKKALKHKRFWTWCKLIYKLPTSRASHRSGALDHNNPGRFCGVKVSPFPADVSGCFSPDISGAGSSPLSMDISWCPSGLRDFGSCKIWDWADIRVWVNPYMFSALSIRLKNKNSIANFCCCCSTRWS